MNPNTGTGGELADAGSTGWKLGSAGEKLGVLRAAKGLGATAGTEGVEAPNAKGLEAGFWSRLNQFSVGGPGIVLSKVLTGAVAASTGGVTEPVLRDGMPRILRALRPPSALLTIRSLPAASTTHLRTAKSAAGAGLKAPSAWESRGVDQHEFKTGFNASRREQDIPLRRCHPRLLDHCSANYCR